MRFHVAGRAFDIDGTTCSGSIDAAAWFGDLRGTGERADAHVAFYVGNRYGAGSAVRANVVADIVGANGAA